MSYEDVHRLSTDVLRDLFNKFAKEVDFNDKELFWKMIYSFYIDPDSNGLKELNGIQCTADGLFSIRRIYRKNGIDIQTVEEYAVYRKIPIFFFPQEKNGINSRRNFVFGDRIDHTLYDIKLYLDAKTEEERNQCKLISTYKLPKTKIWLEELGSFKNLVDWYGIEGIFVMITMTFMILSKEMAKLFQLTSINMIGIGAKIIIAISEGLLIDSLRNKYYKLCTFS